MTKEISVDVNKATVCSQNFKITVTASGNDNSDNDEAMKQATLLSANTQTGWINFSVTQTCAILKKQ